MDLTLKGIAAVEVAADGDDNWATVVTEAVKQLGVEPCYLAIVLIFLGSVWLIRSTLKQQERMEKTRMKHFMILANKEPPEDDDGTN